jgi:FAD/FMN-containing dehydrogenase
VELRQLGGALARVPDGSGAIGRIDGAFLLMAAGLMRGDDAQRTITEAQRVVDALAPWSRHRAHLNFQEEPADPASGYDPAAWTQLVRIRAAIDPNGLFQANHEIPVLAKSVPDQGQGR